MNDGQRRAWRERIERELTANILPFWLAHASDQENGGFYGAVTNDLLVLNDVPRSAVLTARILWSFSAAYRAFGDPAYLEMAQRAYDYLRARFWDPEYGGVYWTIDRHRKPVNDRKHVYAQAFAIYGLAEYFRATQSAASLRLAQELFAQVEAHSYDAVNGGNVESCSRAWGPMSDMRLSDKEPDCRKSMNTLLHLMEAYTCLLGVWPDQRLRGKQRDLIQLFMTRIVDPHTFHLHLFFDDAWNTPPGALSFGHDVEASWLLVEAAEAQGDPRLADEVRTVAFKMAWAVYREGRDADGSVFHERTVNDALDADKHWWVEAEAVVGFYNAYQLSGRDEFAEASERCWDFIETHMVDRVHGDWFKVLRQDGVPYAEQVKLGPWECPYHHSRACLEMLRRLDQPLPPMLGDWQTSP